jgi:putative selenate reductase
MATARNFELVHNTLSAEEAVVEANRCLYCDDVCNICTTVCPNYANIAFTVTPMQIPTYEIQVNSGKASLVQAASMIISQEPQIINIRDFCNECGNCDSFCPTSGAPYKTKPKFHLTKASFAAESNGYQFENGALLFKNDEVVASLAFLDDELVFDSPLLNARFTPDAFLLKAYSCKQEPSGTIDLQYISEMFLLLKNLADFPLFRA